MLVVIRIQLKAYSIYTLLTKLNLESHLYLRQKGATWEESLTTWSVEQEREPADKRAEGGRGGQQQHHHHEVSPSKLIF